MPGIVELLDEQQRIREQFAAARPDDVDVLREIANRVARQLRELEADNRLWDDIELRGSAAAELRSTQIEMRLLTQLDWNLLLDAVGYKGQPNPNELGVWLTEATRLVLREPRPNRDQLNTVRWAIQRLAKRLDEGGYNDSADLRADVRVGWFTAHRLTLSKLLLNASDEAANGLPEVGKAVAAAGVPAAIAGGWPALIGVIAVGAAKTVIDAFKAEHPSLTDLEARRQRDRFLLGATTDAAVYLAANTDEWFNMVCARVESLIPLAVPGVLVKDGAEWQRVLRPIRAQAAGTVASLAVLWDVIAEHGVGAYVGEVIAKASMAMSDLVSHLVRADVAVSECNWQSASGHLEDALRQIGVAKSVVAELIKLLPVVAASIP